jgi:hypothetical protein
MKIKWWVITILLVLYATYKFSVTINLSEKMPVEIVPENIIWGAIRAYHPNLLYLKYEIDFSDNNDLIQIEVDYK